jgi:hypothetical protein
VARFLYNNFVVKILPMSTYIVTFEHNKAVSSIRANMHLADPINIEQTNNKAEIKWMTVFANNKEKSMERANEIAHQIISLLK